MGLGMSNKHDVELARIAATRERAERICDLIKCLFYLVCVSFLGYHLFQASIEWSRGNPETLPGIAKVIENFKIPTILSVIANVVLYVGWQRERGRNRRLVKKEGDFRHQVESSDAHNQRSGLNPHGTMKGE